MPSLISGSCFMRATMLRMCFGLVFVGLSVAAHTAQSEEYPFAPDLNILTIKPVRSDAGWMRPYQFSASVVLTRLPDTAPIGLGLASTSQLFSAAKPQQEIAHPTDANRQHTYDADRVALQRFFRVELKGEQANITFRPRAVSVEGERLKITFRPQSALIEGDRFKIMLQPHSVSMLWGKIF